MTNDNVEVSVVVEAITPAERVEQYLGHAKKVANTFVQSTGMEFDDLFQIASIALWKASNNFDESKGFKFTTFAQRHMVNDLITYTKKHSKGKYDVRMDDEEETFQVVDENANVENEVFNNVMVMEIKKVLDEKEFKFLWDRFVNNKSQKVVAEEWEISQGQVCRIEKRILARVRGAVNEPTIG